MAADVRDQVILELRAAVSHATAGEIQRATKFMKEARKIRVGKSDLRRRNRTPQN